MRRADRFVELYNQLGDYLLRITGEHRYVSYYELISAAARHHTVVRRYAADLRKYGDLRNAIVHDRGYPAQIIAEPSEAALLRFATIVDHIIKPKRLEAFSRKLRCFSKDEPLVAGLRYMRDHDYSQVVVRDSGAIALLTTEGIARWLEQQTEQDIISIVDARVGDALAHEVADSFIVMSRDEMIDSAHAAFTSAIELGQPRLVAVIVTQNGRRTETPLGIVTPWDLLE